VIGLDLGLVLYFCILEGIMYKFLKKDLKDYKVCNGTCYSMANGIGGYSSGSIINSFNRKHYGYLIASLKAPVERMMILGKIDEKIGNISLECQEYDTGIIDNHKYLDEFTYDAYPTFKYIVGNKKITKRIAPVYGKNEVVVSYEIESDEDTILSLNPLFNYRDHSDVIQKEALDFKEEKKNNLYILTPKANEDVSIQFYYSDGVIKENKKKITDALYYQYDFETGDDRKDYYYTPITLEVKVLKNKVNKITIICALNEIECFDSDKLIQEYKDRIDSLKEKSGIKDSLAKDLVWSADSFISERKSTGLKTILAGLPWFTDWGRDTMIAFTGLTLVTKRFDDAKEILKSFALYEKNGLIPNMFPDDGGEPWYNTVDASLWYFYACYKYIEYTKDKKFILEEIYPTLQNIIYAYSHKTDNNIHMDSDNLVSCGDKDTQITWMDVKTNGIAVTPRFGKPVEINALWYNALRIMDILSKDANDPTDYMSMAMAVKKSFNEKFYNKETGCLYDTVEPYDPKIRPNQCFALSLPFKVVDENYVKSIFDVITKDLYNVYGLRSLSPRDPEFKPKYEGSLWDRDMAYHMGTTWGFLIGTYFDAYLYVNKKNPNVKNEINVMAHKFEKHLNEGCLNGVAEIFDGDIANRTRGCYNQAWSIGELLRSYYENVLK
jgi:predicted glycogen debranching enzyme